MKNRFLPSLLLTVTLLGLGCQAPLPTPTPEISYDQPTRVSEALPTATPRASLTPLPTFTPTATNVPLPQPPPTATPDAGVYRNPELGFSFTHPLGWQIEETGGNLPAAVVYDDDDPVQMIVGSEPIEPSTTLDSYIVDLAQTFGVSTTVELLNQTPTTLASGTDATRFQFSWTDGDSSSNVDEDAFQAEGLATIANGQGFALIMTGRPEIISTRLRTFDAIAASFTLDQPELFGISRENALVLLIDQPLTLDPALTYETAGGLVDHLYSGLVKIGADLQPQGDLAESWEVGDQGSSYTFRLRDGLTFHSGERLTAENVVASWERAQQDGGPLAQALFQGIDSFEAVDAETLRVELVTPYSGFLFRAAQPAMMVLSPADLARVAGGDPLTRPDGSGPFSLRRYEPDDVILLDRFEAYHTPAKVENLIYLPFGETSTSAYESGLLDVSGVASFNLARVQDPADPLAADLVTTDLLCTEMLIFNTSQAPFDNLDNRLIFAQTVDQQRLSDVVLSGSRPPASIFLPPQMPGGGVPSAEIEPLEISRLSLPEEPVKLTLASEGGIDDLITAVIDGWREGLGVEVEIETLPPSEYNAQLSDGTLQGNIFWQDWCSFGSDPADILELLFHSRSPLNMGGYASESFDAAIEAAAAGSDPAERVELYQAADTQLQVDAAGVPLTYGRSHKLMRPYITGFVPAPIDYLWQTEVVLDREGE